MEHVEKLARALEEQFDGIFEDIAAARNKYNLEAATSFELDQLCEFFSGVDRYGKTDEELRDALRVAIAIEGSLVTLKWYILNSDSEVYELINEST